MSYTLEKFVYRYFEAINLITNIRATYFIIKLNISRDYFEISHIHKIKMGNSQSAAWSRTFTIIKEAHDAAYHKINEAITLEEQEKPYEAVEKYKEGILLINDALDIQVTSPENPDFSWEQATVMIQKMKRTRAEVIMRINCLTSAPGFVHQEPPPPYEETISNTAPRNNPRTYSDLAAALNDLHIESTDLPIELIYTHDNVQLYFISPDGTVIKTSEPETLNIAVIPGNENAPRNIFLQIGEWIYPLVPGVSPCYRTDYGAFILPDVHSEISGSSVGIILPPDADASVYEILESILHGIITQTPSTPFPTRRTRRSIEPSSISERISSGLSTGGYYISQGLIMGAEKLGSFVNYGTPKVINYLTPTSEATPISPTVIKGFDIASNATTTAATFTNYVADKVGYATHALGQYLAPHIQKQGTKLLSSGFNLSQEEASSKVNGILTVAAGAVEGFSSIYQGLHTSGSILGQNLSNNTVRIVQYKYGEPAGHIASNTFNTVGNVLNISGNARFFTPKGIVKSAAKEAGKAMVEDIKISNYMLPQNQVGTNLYPNLEAESFKSLASHNQEK